MCSDQSNPFDESVSGPEKAGAGGSRPALYVWCRLPLSDLAFLKKYVIESNRF